MTEDPIPPGWWEGYASGRDEAETRDLAYDAVVARAERAERRLATRDAAIIDLAAEWDLLSKGETGTTRRLRELLQDSDDLTLSPEGHLIGLLLSQARQADPLVSEAARLRCRVAQLEGHMDRLLAIVRQRSTR
jgi:hypothetical protein